MVYRLFKYFLGLPIFFIMTTAIASSPAAHDTEITLEQFSPRTHYKTILKNRPEFFLIAPALKLLQSDRNNTDITKNRTINHLYYALKSSLASKNHIVHTNDPHCVSYTTEISDKPDATEIKTFTTLFSVPHYSCFSMTAKKITLETSNPEIITNLIDYALVDNVPSVCLQTLINSMFMPRTCTSFVPDYRHYLNTMYSLDKEGDPVTYYHTLFHSSIVRFAHLPTDDSRYIIYALLRAGTPLDYLDATYYTSGNHGTSRSCTYNTPLELLTDDELHILIDQPYADLKDAYRNLINSQQIKHSHKPQARLIQKINRYTGITFPQFVYDAIEHDRNGTKADIHDETCITL